MEYINNNMFWYVRMKVIFFMLKDICNKIYIMIKN